MKISDVLWDCKKLIIVWISNIIFALIFLAISFTAGPYFYSRGVNEIFSIFSAIIGIFNLMCAFFLAMNYSCLKWFLHSWESEEISQYSLEITNKLKICTMVMMGIQICFALSVFTLVITIIVFLASIASFITYIVLFFKLKNSLLLV